MLHLVRLESMESYASTPNVIDLCANASNFNIPSRFWVCQTLCDNFHEIYFHFGVCRGRLNVLRANFIECSVYLCACVTQTIGFSENRQFYFVVVGCVNTVRDAMFSVYSNSSSLQCNCIESHWAVNVVERSAIARLFCSSGSVQRVMWINELWV